MHRSYGEERQEKIIGHRPKQDVKLLNKSAPETLPVRSAYQLRSFFRKSFTAPLVKGGIAYDERKENQRGYRIT